MIVIGADTHKSNHSLAAIDAGTGQVVGERSIAAREPGHLEALRWARELGPQRVWAIGCSQMRWHLVDLAPELEASLPASGLDRTVQLDRVVCALRRMPRTARVKVSLKLVAHIRALTRQAKALQRELDVLVARECPQLLAEQGCGTLTAATIIGRIAGAERFATDSRFARQAGTAPIPASSAVAIDTAITAAATASSTARFTRSRSPEREGILRLRRSWRASAQRARATAKHSVV
jgi:transposase